MPKLTMDSFAVFSVLLIIACGLLIMMVSVFHIDQAEYQLLLILGMNSSLLGTIVISQAKKLREYRKEAI